MKDEREGKGMKMGKRQRHWERIQLIDKIPQIIYNSDKTESIWSLGDTRHQLIPSIWWNSVYIFLAEIIKTSKLLNYWYQTVCPQFWLKTIKHFRGICIQFTTFLSAQLYHTPPSSSFSPLLGEGVCYSSSYVLAPSRVGRVDSGVTTPCLTPICTRLPPHMSAKLMPELRLPVSNESALCSSQLCSHTYIDTHISICKYCKVNRTSILIHFWGFAMILCVRLIRLLLLPKGQTK